MDFDHKKFERLIPPSVHPVMEELHQYGFIVTLVGGSVRDYFMTGTLGRDWDVELSHETISYNQSDWKDLGKKLTKFGKVSFLPYDIIRLDLEKIQMEFSPPRIEVFRTNDNGHSNFDAEFDLKLPFNEAIQRRDFTINAMGLRFRASRPVEFLDPCQGLVHLNSKKLYPVGKDFSKDPVRFLRAIRFSVKYKFDLSQDLTLVMKGMSLDKVSPVYFWSEMQKSENPLGFLERIFLEKSNHPELLFPLDIDSSDLTKLKTVLTHPKSHDSWIMALEWIGINSEGWRKYFSLSSDSSRKLARWAQNSRLFQKLLPENFQGEFEQVRESESFEKLFDWYFSTKQLLQKNPELPLLKMIDEYLPEWIHLYKFEAPKDVKHIDPPLRAKYQVWNLCQRI